MGIRNIYFISKSSTDLCRTLIILVSVQRELWGILEVFWWLRSSLFNRLKKLHLFSEHIGTYYHMDIMK